MPCPPLTSTAKGQATFREQEKKDSYCSTALFFAHKDSSFLTGQTLAVNGGKTLGF